MRARLTFGLVLFLGMLPLNPSALQAGNFFRKGCGQACRKDVVKLPGQEIVIQPARPNVIVNESVAVNRGRSRGFIAAPPVVATIYTPSTFSLPPIGFVEEPRGFSAPRGLCDSSREMLDAAYQSIEMEHNFRLLQARQLAEQQTMRNLASQMTRTLRQASEFNVVDNGASKITSDEISKKLTELTNRIANLEKMVLIHDNYIRSQVNPMLKDTEEKKEKE